MAYFDTTSWTEQGSRIGGLPHGLIRRMNGVMARSSKNPEHMRDAEIRRIAARRAVDNLLRKRQCTV